MNTNRQHSISDTTCFNCENPLHERELAQGLCQHCYNSIYKEKSNGWGD